MGIVVIIIIIMAMTIVAIPVARGGAATDYAVEQMR